VDDAPVTFTDNNRNPLTSQAGVTEELRRVISARETAFRIVALLLIVGRIMLAAGSMLTLDTPQGYFEQWFINEGRDSVSWLLWAAAYRGHKPMVTLLSESGAKPSWHSVHAAAGANHAKTLQVLLAPARR
jgi:hypothetical protein